MDIQYFGWSGVTIRHANTLVGFDLFGDAVTWEKLEPADTTILCLTHGHPEHSGSMRQFLSRPDGQSRLMTTHVVSSLPVVQHVTQGTMLPSSHAHEIKNRQNAAVSGIQITAFTWKHLPLLPPGILPKIDYFFHLISHPLNFVQIGMSSLSLPTNAPTLGFHLIFPDGQRVLNYAEGLHRLTDRQEVDWVARHLPADTLLLAVEPEDVEAIPQWLELLQPSSVFLYEAHRPWRELFRLPYLDLNSYADQLAARFSKLRCNVLVSPGQIIRQD